MIDIRSIDVMLATNHAAFSDEKWIFELKYDGHRALATSKQIVSRNHKDVTEHYSEIIGALQAIRGDFVIDGELCVIGDNGVPDFERMTARSRRKRGGDLVTFFAFDMLFDAEGNDIRQQTVIERKRKLKALLPTSHNRLRYVDYELGIGERMYEYAVGIGMEGVVGKRIDSPYVAGSNRYWIKAKPAGFHDEGFKRKKR